MTEYKFYLVWSPQGNTPPSRRHLTYENANDEAERLANCNPGVFFYVAEVKAYHRKSPEKVILIDGNPNWITAIRKDISSTVNHAAAITGFKMFTKKREYGIRPQDPTYGGPDDLYVDVYSLEPVGTSYEQFWKVQMDLVKRYRGLNLDINYFKDEIVLTP